MLYPSPAELAFIRLMGGRTIEFRRIRNRRTGFRLAIVVSMGKTLRRERVKREVRVGRCFVDFGNDIGRAIEVDGNKWHTDVVHEMERDNYLAQFGWRVLHVRAPDIVRDPAKTRQVVHEFLSA